MDRSKGFLAWEQIVDVTQSVGMALLGVAFCLRNGNGNRLLGISYLLFQFLKGSSLICPKAITLLRKLMEQSHMEVKYDISLLLSMATGCLIG